MLLLVLFLNLIPLISCWFYGRPAPGQFTRGEIWPLPWNVSQPNTLTNNIDPSKFQFSTPLSNCDLLQASFQRYQTWAFPGFTTTTNVPNPNTTITQLIVNVTKGCDSGYPQMDMDESYNIYFNTTSHTGYLNANEIWGAIRGLESFSQLIYQDSNNSWFVKLSTISDQPRFPHRGILMDCARHYISVRVIKQNLDLMAMSKMNVFHWHLTDSESFPYVSAKFPNLSAKGAYSPKHVYTQAQIKDVINYARLLGIRVVAEFDTPGHMGAWEHGQPGLLAKCYAEEGWGDTDPMISNIIDPTKDANLQFISQFFDEALHLFPDNYMHFGGDETIRYQNACWLNNSDILTWMQSHNMSNDNSKLLKYYLSNLVQFVQKSRSNASMIFWQEVLDQNVAPNTSIAHVWKGNSYEDSMQEMNHVTQNGHLAIYSSCWYLDLIKYGVLWDDVNETAFEDRGMYYQCNPTDFNGTDAQKKLVLGGEACLWGEIVDGANVIQRMWPNAGAAAERLWSDLEQTRNSTAAWPRFHEHRCRMIARGYQVKPASTPDFCPDFWDPSLENPAPVIQSTNTPQKSFGKRLIVDNKFISLLVLLIIVAHCF